MQSANSSEVKYKEFVTCLKQGKVEVVKQILKNIPQQLINKIDQDLKQPPLYFAVLADGDETSQELLNLLLSHGAEIKFKDNMDQTVLFYACRQGKEKSVQTLINHGLDLNQTDQYGQTPLFYAASENHLGIVRNHSTKQRVNHVDKLADQTPLYYAAKKGHMEMCKLLIQKGAEIVHLDRSNKTAADLARKYKYPEVADYLAGQLKRSRQMVRTVMVSQSVEESNIEKRSKKKEQSKPIRQTYKIVQMAEDGSLHDLTQEEVKQMVRDKPELESYLANPQLIPQQVMDKSNSDHWQKVTTKVLTQCIRHKGSYWFMDPVDAVKYQILDYYEVIQKPMDLNTIRKKLAYNWYKNVKEFKEDMQLIWKNCYKYNGEDHQISRCAKQLQNSFKEYYVLNGMQRFEQE